jgi:hypothetical protein
MKNQLVGELTETEIPSLPPKLSEGGRPGRRRHDGFGANAEALPKESDQLESAEVKEQDQTQHPYPAA